jgi:hypothetical protein
MRVVLLALSFACAAAPAVAQHAEHAGGHGAGLPAGWHARRDNKAADAELDGVQFMAMGNAFHVLMGMTNAIFWNPQNVAKGEFELAATFAQTKKPEMHPEGYGLVFNGSNLDQANQSYVYFLVKDGQYLINHRAGNEVHKIVPWTANDAIVKPDASGQSTNTLAVHVKGNDVNYLVNGKVVHTQQRAHINPDGIVGLRVNMHLDMHISDFKVK